MMQGLGGKHWTCTHLLRVPKYSVGHCLCHLRLAQNFGLDQSRERRGEVMTILWSEYSRDATVHNV